MVQNGHMASTGKMSRRRGNFDKFAIRNHIQLRGTNKAKSKIEIIPCPFPLISSLPLCLHFYFSQLNTERGPEFQSIIIG